MTGRSRAAAAAVAALLCLGLPGGVTGSGESQRGGAPGIFKKRAATRGKGSTARVGDPAPNPPPSLPPTFAAVHRGPNLYKARKQKHGKAKGGTPTGGPAMVDYTLPLGASPICTCASGAKAKLTELRFEWAGAAPLDSLAVTVTGSTAYIVSNALDLKPAASRFAAWTSITVAGESAALHTSCSKPL